jgi:hypothetical protein
MIKINGVVYEGDSVIINRGGNCVIIGDGSVLHNVEFTSAVVKIEIIGDPVNVSSEGPITVNGNVRGNVRSGSSVSCHDVAGSVSAGGSVNCGTVEGSVTAGGAVNCRR